MRFRSSFSALAHRATEHGSNADGSSTSNDAADLPQNADEKSPGTVATVTTESKVVDPNFQHGVQEAQATTQLWSLKHLILAYVL